jgi:hypothetical protein
VVTLATRAEDGTERACLTHRRQAGGREPTIGRYWSDANGYVRRRIRPGRRGVEYEHRWVWEQAHGPIPVGHHVHHINHDRADNRLENLELRRAFDHLSEHSTERHADGSLDNRGSKSARYRSDLDDEEIMRRVQSGESYRQIGRAMGAAHNVIANHYRRATS